MAYTTYYSTSASGPWTKWGTYTASDEPGSLHVWIDDVADVQFWWRVTTWYTRDGMTGIQSEMSAPVLARTSSQPTQKLPAPWLLVSNYYPGKIMVAWGSVVNATGYKLYRSLSPESGYILRGTYNSSTTRIDDTSVQPYTPYYYKVQAVQNGVDGQLSAREMGSSTAP
jgi:hypothetical protein